MPSRHRPRPFHLITALAARQHRIHLIAAATSEEERTAEPALDAVCERVEIIPVRALRSLWNCTRGLLGPAPLQARYCHAPQMAAAVGRAVASTPYDIVHIEHLRAALYGLPLQGIPRVYDAVDCMSRLLAHTAAAGPTAAARVTARAELRRTQAFERELLGRFDHVLVTAASERDALAALDRARRDVPVHTDPDRRGAAGGRRDVERAPLAGKVTVLPNGVDVDHFAPQPTRRDLATVVFVGRMGYHANLAAAYRLVTDIMPRVWAQRPDAHLIIVGTDPPASLRRVAARARGPVRITGAVPDVRPFLARATLAIAPLRYAVGIQNKVLEAMAMATPMVATAAATAALGARDGAEVLVADDDAGLAAAALRLLDDALLARRVGLAGRRYVTESHDWRAVAAELEGIYHTAAGHTVLARSAS